MKEKLIDLLKTLRLRGMAAALDDSLTALSQKKLAPTSWLEQLLHAEIADRQARSYQYQLRLANFPMPRDLDSFDFKDSPVNETQVRQLYTGEYLTTARNIVFVGGTGTGKTHLATALAREVVLKGMRARFYSVVDLVNQLDAEKRNGRACSTPGCEKRAENFCEVCEIPVCDACADKNGSIRPVLHGVRFPRKPKF